MWSSNYTKCLVRGHVSSTFIYKREEYTYCVRCGKLRLNHHTDSVDYTKSKPQHITG